MNKIINEAKDMVSYFEGALDCVAPFGSDALVSHTARTLRYYRQHIPLSVEGVLLLDRLQSLSIRARLQGINP